MVTEASFGDFLKIGLWSGLYVVCEKWMDKGNMYGLSTIKVNKIQGYTGLYTSCLKFFLQGMEFFSYTSG